MTEISPMTFAEAVARGLAIMKSMGLARTPEVCREVAKMTFRSAGIRWPSASLWVPLAQMLRSDL